MLVRMAPSAAEGGASKETGPSSSITGEDKGLVGLPRDTVVTVETSAEAGEGGVKVRGVALMPGLFRGGPVGERVRLALEKKKENIRVQC